jgi:tetratricopeptide (TPR) repeat protein
MAKASKQQKINPSRVQTKTVKEIAVTFTEFNFEKWYPFFIALFGFLLYANTLTHDYVLDDETVMEKNKFVTKGISAIPEIMLTAYRAGSQDRQENLYRPLSVVMFAIEWQLSPNKPFLGHLINVLLYALTGFLLYKLARKWFPDKHSFVLFSICILFMVHPLHTEVIANIKSRDEILGLLFAILSLSAFHNFATRKNILQLLLGTFCFFLAMLSKESTVTLAAAIPLSLFFFTKPDDNKKYMFTVIALVITVILYFILRNIAIGGLVTFQEVSVLNNSLVGTENKLDQFATAIVLVGYYILLFFFPHPLSFDYSLNTIPIATFSDVRFLISMTVIIALAVYVLINLKKKNAIAFGILFFGITLSIVSNIFVIIEATLAERFMYVPSLGLCIAVILGMEKVTKFIANTNFSFLSVLQKNKAFSIVLSVVLILFSLKTFTRNLDWKDNFTLFSVDKDHNPNSYRNLSGYCNVLFGKKIVPLKDGDPLKLEYCKEAIFYTNKSLAITQDNFSAWSLLVYCYLQLKDYPQALASYETGINYYTEKTPYLDNFHMMGANAYYYSGNLPKALEVAKAGIAITDTNALLWNSYGMIASDLNDLQTAKNALTKSLQLDSTSADTWYNMGNFYAKNGDYVSAISTYNKVEKMDAAILTSINTYNNTGNCYAVLKQYDKAIENYKKALAFDPTNKSALQNIAITYNNLGQSDKAKEYNARLQGLP